MMAGAISNAYSFPAPIEDAFTSPAPRGSKTDVTIDLEFT